MAKETNEAARAALDAEKKQFGFKRPVAIAAEDSDFEDDDENIDDEELDDDNNEDEEDESDDLEDDDEEDEDSDEDDSDEDEDDEEDEDHKTTKKSVPTSVYNRLRKEKRAGDKLLADALAKNKELEDALPDDFEKRTDDLLKEIGVEDPDNTKKVIKFIKDAALGKVQNLEDKLAKLEALVEDKNKVDVSTLDEFPTEWKAFVEDVIPDEYPNATKEELKDVRALMEKLSKDPKTGGIEYIHEESGQKAINPFPLDYILHKHRKQFDELVTLRISEGMESTRTQGAGKESNSGEVKHLNHKSSATDIRNLDKRYSRVVAETNTLRSPEKSTI